MTKLKCLLGLALWLLGSAPLHAAFGLTTAPDSYTVDTNAGLVFKIRRTDNGSSTQSAGDLMSMVYNGIEYQNLSRGSQVNSGFDYLYNGISAVTVGAEVVNGDFIKITVTAGYLTHYYMARNGFPHIYMATYFTVEPETQYLARYIVRIPEAKLPDGPAPSDIRGNTGSIESGDIFGMADGTTRSKHYSNLRLKDWSHIGATGPGIGIWMVRSNHEGDSGGPFYRSLINQCGSDQEITYIMNYGQAQTEPYRLGILNGPYTLVFTDGSEPATPDTAWISGMGLTGFVGTAGRGGVSATGITGRDASEDYTVGFSNSTAQYWTDAAADNGAFTKPGMLPGNYTLKIYKGEYAVHSTQVTVSAGATTALGTLAIAADPAATEPLWRIGKWDGTPREFINGDKVTTMHPSDVRMASWNPGLFVIGASDPATGIPAYQWKDINGSQQVRFNLGAGQLIDSTLRVGLTIAFEGARPNITVNSWTSPFQGPSSQPDSRSLTTGSYRGNNVTYTFNVPASALVAGTNTLSISPISGSGASGFLSAGYSLDCIDFFQGTARIVAIPGAPASLSATASPNQVTLEWSAAAGATSYTIGRSTAPGGPYTSVADNVAGTTFTDTGLTNGGTYHYIVSGVNSSGTGLPSPEAATTAGGLVAYYALEDNAQDSSGYGNHGTANAVTYAPEGGSRSAQFNGSTSHIVIPRVVQDDFTVSLWVKTTGTGGTGTQWWSGKGLVDGEINGSAADWGMVLLNGKLAFGVGATDTTLLSAGAINDGEWHHVAATRKSATGAIELYVDGARQTTGTGPTGARVAPPALRIGGIQTGAAAGFLSGGIDNVRLHNRVLTGPEIAAFFDAGRQFPAAPASLTATAIDGGRIDLAWPASPTATGYTVKRATGSGGPYAPVAAGLTATAFSDTGLTQGTTYHYVVSGSNPNGEGADSLQASATPLPPPATAHLRFDESGGTIATDSTGHGWNGTLLNGATRATGRINRALSLDGIDDHLILPAGVVAGLNDITIATWVKWNGGDNWQRAFDFGSGTSNYLFFSPATSFGTARFAIRTPAVPEQVISAPTLAIGAWTHVAVTLSGGTGTLYINGAPAGSNSAMTLAPASLGSTPANYLGKSQFAADANLNGLLDEFQIHARALTPAEITSLATPPSAPFGLAATPGDARVDLSWNPAAGASGYQLKRATASGGPYTPIAGPLTDRYFTDTAVTNGTTYHYVVTALAGIAESAASPGIAATPLSPAQAWRQTHFGTFANTGDAADSADPDGDKTSNETERRLGLDPKDGDSAFRLEGSVVPGGFRITWPSAPGLTFRIHRSSALVFSGVPIATVVGAGTFTDPGPPLERAFYRIELMP